MQCQIDLLSAQKTGRDVIHALDSMPKSLHGTYETILCQIPSYDRKIARETLLWLSSGYQEITLPKLSKAVILTKGDQSIDDDYRLFDPHVILSICQGLIFYDERTDAGREAVPQRPAQRQGGPDCGAGDAGRLRGVCEGYGPAGPGVPGVGAAV